MFPAHIDRRWLPGNKSGPGRRAPAPQAFARPRPDRPRHSGDHGRTGKSRENLAGPVRQSPRRIHGRLLLLFSRCPVMPRTSPIVTHQLDQSRSVEPGQRAIGAHEDQDGRLLTGKTRRASKGRPVTASFNVKLLSVAHLAIHGQTRNPVCATSAPEHETRSRTSQVRTRANRPTRPVNRGPGRPGLGSVSRCSFVASLSEDIVRPASRCLHEQVGDARRLSRIDPPSGFEASHQLSQPSTRGNNSRFQSSVLLATRSVGRQALTLPRFSVTGHSKFARHRL